MTILCALLVLLVAILVTTILHLYMTLLYSYSFGICLLFTMWPSNEFDTMMMLIKHVSYLYNLQQSLKKNRCLRDCVKSFNQF